MVRSDRLAERPQGARPQSRVDVGMRLLGRSTLLPCAGSSLSCLFRPWPCRRPWPRLCMSTSTLGTITRSIITGRHPTSTSIQRWPSETMTRRRTTTTNRRSRLNPATLAGMRSRSPRVTSKFHNPTSTWANFEGRRPSPRLLSSDLPPPLLTFAFTVHRPTLESQRAPRL